MKMRNLIFGLAAVCLLSFTTNSAWAQLGEDIERTTAGSTHLLIPMTAHTASLGSTVTAGLSNGSGLEGLFSNPAALTVNQGTNAMFSNMQYVADINLNYFGVAQRFGANQVALTLSSWDFGDIPLQTEANPEISDVTWTAGYTTVGFSLAREFTDRIAAGFTMKLVNESIDDMSSSGFAFDAGMAYVAGESGLRFGVSLKNFGPARNFGGTGLVKFSSIPGQDPKSQSVAVAIEGAEYELPSLLNFGVSYTRDLSSSTQVTVLGNFRSNSFSPDQYAGGLEFGIADVLFLRGGYEIEDQSDKSFYTGLNAGAGLKVPVESIGLRIDYAYRATDFFDAVHLITASVEL